MRKFFMLKNKIRIRSYKSNCLSFTISNPLIFMHNKNITTVYILRRIHLCAPQVFVKNILLLF